MPRIGVTVVCSDAIVGLSKLSADSGDPGTQGKGHYSRWNAVSTSTPLRSVWSVEQYRSALRRTRYAQSSSTPSLTRTLLCGLILSAPTGTDRSTASVPRKSHVILASTSTASSWIPRFAATERMVLSSQIASAAARISPEHGTSPLPPAAACNPDEIWTSGYASGATTQCCGSLRS